MQNIMALPTLTCSNPSKIHKFYKKLVINVQSLEILGKLKEISGYMRMCINKLEGIRSDLVRTVEWDFPQLVEAVRKWTERNPIPSKMTEKLPEPPFPQDRSFQVQQKDK